MKSKFAPIVRLKKEVLEGAQSELALINREIHAIEQEITDQKASLMMLSTPSMGDFSLFRQHQLFTTRMRAMIEETKQKLIAKFQEQNEAQFHLNEVLQEFEKFKYLEAEEEKAHLEYLKKQEAQFLDEVAIMGYNNKKGR